MPESDFFKHCVIQRGEFSAVTPWPVAVPSRERLRGPEALGPTLRLGGHLPGWSSGAHGQPHGPHGVSPVVESPMGFNIVPWKATWRGKRQNWELFLEL